jgi:molybdopterin converting factor small subunit
MHVKITVIGPDVKLKQEIALKPSSPTLMDMIGFLMEQCEGFWRSFLKDDRSLRDGWAVLVNGRNIASLDGLGTRLNEGDEITFTVIVAGGAIGWTGIEAGMKEDSRVVFLPHPWGDLSKTEGQE